MNEASLVENYKRIKTLALKAAGNRPFTLIAVSKTQPIEAIEALYHQGQRDFGENYVQQLTVKAQQLSAKGLHDIRWHMIGHLQSNKVKALLPFVHSVHAVSSEKLATELGKRWNELGRTEKLPIFIELNIDNEATKSGVTQDQLPSLLAAIRANPLCAHLSIQGLMAIPNPNVANLQDPFTRLLKLAVAEGLPCLSMGMSDDFETALRCGSTHIRVGTAIFGERV